MHPRHPAFLVALNNGVELVLVRSSDVGRSSSLDNELHQQLGRLGEHRPEQAHVLVHSVGRLSVGNHAKGYHHLLQWMRLQLARRINALLEERLVHNSQIHTPTDGARDTELRLKVPVIVDREHTANTEAVSHSGVHAGRKVTTLVATAPRGGATIKPSSRDALGAHASAHRHEHIDVRLHHSSNVRAVVLGQQGGGGQDLLLLEVHTESRDADD